MKHKKFIEHIDDPYEHDEMYNNPMDDSIDRTTNVIFLIVMGFISVCILTVLYLIK
jgi:hypothetical protein